jgi:hypothetical protein
MLLELCRRLSGKSLTLKRASRLELADITGSTGKIFPAKFSNFQNE